MSSDNLSAGEGAERGQRVTGKSKAPYHTISKDTAITKVLTQLDRGTCNGDKKERIAETKKHHQQFCSSQGHCQNGKEISSGLGENKKEQNAHGEYV